MKAYTIAKVVGKVARVLHGRKHESNAERADMIFNHHSRHPDITYEQAEKFVDDHMYEVKRSSVPTPKELEDEWGASDGGG